MDGIWSEGRSPSRASKQEANPGGCWRPLGFNRGRFDDTLPSRRRTEKYTYAVEKAESRTRPRSAGRPGFGGQRRFALGGSDAARAVRSGGLRLHPLAVGLRRFDRGLDEFHPLDAIVDGREMRGLQWLLADPGGFDGQRHLRIDVGEAFEIAFRMARRDARHPRRRFARIRTPRVTMRVDCPNGVQNR